MKRQILILAGLVVLSAAPVWGKPRSKSEIMRAASKTLIKSDPNSTKSRVKGRSLEILQETGEYTVVGFPGSSHAIISNDDLLPEVLAYSATPFEEDSDNPGFNWWLRSISAAASQIMKEQEQSETTKPDPSRFAPEVPQLMSDVWGQMEPFNNLCPMEYNAAGRPTGRCLVGCVATSATQVMHYHRYPPKGEGMHIDMQTSDAFGKPIPLKIDFADYTFEWNKMRDSYSVGNYTQEEADAVASLAYPVGVSFGMIYGTGASGTYSDSAVYALKKYLKFENAVLHDRTKYNESQWMEMIFAQLSKNQPILYSGADPWGTVGGGGHAFVLDGYDSNGLVHVNWGWYGRNDGYYEVSLLNPRIHSFVNQQDMILGVAPPQNSASEGSVLRLTGTLTSKELSEAVAKSMEGTYFELDLSQATMKDNKLPDMAFYGSSFIKITLPASVQSLGKGCFGANRYLREVVVPDSDIKRNFIFEDDIFYSSDGTEVISVLPYYHNVKSVQEDYTSLLVFRPGVKTIRAYAAEGCTRIQGVVIPASVVKIGEYAFKGCPALKSVRVESAVPPVMAARAFATLDAGYTGLYVPAASSDTYYRTGEWGKFFDFDNVFEYGTNVVARSYVREVGEPNPVFGYQIFGDYVTGEPELTCEATQDSKEGYYPIRITIGSLSGDNITLTDGVLKVLRNGSSEVSETEAQETSFDVFALDGRIILRNADSIEGLDKGIYVINGKKVIVK